MAQDAIFLDVVTASVDSGALAAVEAKADAAAQAAAAAQATADAALANAPVAKGYISASGLYVPSYGDIAVTKTGVGTWSITSATYPGLKIQYIPSSAGPRYGTFLKEADGIATLYTWNNASTLTDASGLILCWS